MKTERLSISCGIFQETRDRFDQALHMALRQMDRLRIGCGTVELKIEITLKQGAADGLLPEFTGSVGVNLPMKAKVPVPVIGGIRVAQEPGADGFIVGSDQMSIFDMMEEAETE